ncbi:hypothetical protein VSS74_25505 [Conexibacter stalactiti]|uniref:Integral membrane protein n=1 Tax=Conexibacter stalactiti TaxID=1940611 RepID=A0ABU4HXY9_9ACTN|nr:hypothetical protein [Conexibacter stalactiti]MDW5597734.1 hypothetical protein [Conexibacter stalactiti]MEC5038376.1 hypothetical protein [Conexibacter stalactiti]
MSAGAWALVGFLAAFLFIRASTRLMRSPRVPWWPGSIETSGVHVHHLVIGIALMIGAGFVTYAQEADGTLLALLAIVFGIGAGLTIDEFALWLYLEDVYWAREGRASVDVAIVVAVLGLLIINTGGPFDTDDESDWALLGSVLFHVAWAALVLVKGKVRLAAIGFFFPPIYAFAGIRLARPNSIWARRFYKDGSRKLEKATARAATWDARRERWLDRIGGAPSIERAPD